MQRCTMRGGCGRCVTGTVGALHFMSPSLPSTVRILSASSALQGLRVSTAVACLLLSVISERPFVSAYQKGRLLKPELKGRQPSASPPLTSGHSSSAAVPPRFTWPLSSQPQGCGLLPLTLPGVNAQPGTCWAPASLYFFDLLPLPEAHSYKKTNWGFLRAHPLSILPLSPILSILPSHHPRVLPKRMHPGGLS